MASKQTRQDIEDAYLGNIDPELSTVDAPESETLKNLIAALSATAGATAATGPVGGVAPAASPQPAQKTQVKLYDDQTKRPEMTAKDYLVQALIPLGTGLLGGLGGGNRGAMVGVKSGLDAVGKEQDETDKRWNKLEDDKSKLRSHVITAKILADMKAKNGESGRNKVRYIQSTLIDPKTKQVYYRKFDRETGESSVVDGSGNAVPWNKDLFDRMRETGESTVSEYPWPTGTEAPAPSESTPAPAPAQSAPKNHQGKGVAVALTNHPEISAEGQMAEDPSIPPKKEQEGLLIEAPNPDDPNEPKHFVAKGGRWLPADSKGGILSDGIVPKTLPSKVKTPGGSNLTEPTPSTTPAAAVNMLPGPGASEDDFDRAAQAYRASVKPRLEALNAKQKVYGAMIEHPAPLEGENELDARRRVANAQKQLGKVEEDVNKLADEEAKTLNNIAIRKAEAKARGASKGGVNKRTSELVSALKGTSRDPIGMQKMKIAAAEHIEGLLRDHPDGNLEPTLMNELAISMATMFSPGVPAESTIQGLKAHTAQGKVAELYQYISGSPAPANQQEFAKLMFDTVKRQKAISEDQRKREISRILPGYADVKKGDPDGYKRTLMTNGLSEADFDENGVYKPKAIDEKKKTAPKPEDVDKMSDAEVEAKLRERGLLK